MKDYDRLTFAKSDTKKPLARRLGGGMRLFGILGIMRLVPHQILAPPVDVLLGLFLRNVRPHWRHGLHVGVDRDRAKNQADGQNEE